MGCVITQTYRICYPIHTACYVLNLSSILGVERGHMRITKQINLKRFSELLYVFTVIFLLYLIWFRIDFLYVDISGNIASARSFVDGYFQSFNEHFFAGYIQNLFYPPLQDLMLGSLIHLLGYNATLAYQCYISILSVTFLFLLCKISRSFENSNAASFVSLSFLFLFFLNKQKLFSFQGLALTDLILTGLSAQFLGSIFLLLYLLEQRKESRYPFLIIWATLATLSHLVVGLVMFFILVLEFLYYRHRRILERLLWTVILSLFFWGPFFLQSRYIASMNSYYEPAWLLWIANIFCLFLFRNSQARFYILASFLILSGSVVNTLSLKLGFTLPSFHYNRLQIYSLFFIILAFATLIADNRVTNVRKYVLITFWGFILLQFPKIQIQSLLTELNAPRLTWSATTAEAPRGRTWVIDDSRAIVNSSIESMLYLGNTEQNSMKGLFWESSRNNTHLAGILKNIEPRSFSILDAKTKESTTCEEKKCLMDKLLYYYGVTELFLEDENSSSQTGFYDLSCYRSYISDLKKQGRAHPTTSLSLSWPPSTFQGYGLSSVSKNRSQSPYLEPFSFSAVRLYPIQTQSQRVDAAYNLSFPCTAQNLIFLDQAKRDLLKLDFQKVVTNPNHSSSLFESSFEKISKNAFRIKIDSKTAVPFLIKFSYFPGFKLLDSSGNSLPLHESFPHMVGIGSGEMTLTFERPWWVLLMNTVSIIGLFLFLVSFVKLRRIKIKTAASPQRHAKLAKSNKDQKARVT